MNLGKEAARFATELGDLLNGTITTGVRLTSVLVRGTAVVGYQIKATDLTTVGIPVTLGSKQPTGYLGLSFRLVPDEHKQFLMVQSSVAGFFVDAELDRPLMHYDFERDKGDGYPEAHLQVDADSEAWNELCVRVGIGDRPLAKLHFPVGGRRFRPTVEELIDFLVTEVHVDALPGWTAKVQAGRELFEERQRRAAIRRRPEWALDQLRKMGHIE